MTCILRGAMLNQYTGVEHAFFPSIFTSDNLCVHQRHWTSTMELPLMFDVWGSHCCSSQMIIIRPAANLGQRPNLRNNWMSLVPEAHRHTASCSYANLLIRLWKFFLVTLLHFKQWENRNIKHIFMSMIPFFCVTSQQHNYMSLGFITFRYLSMPARESGANGMKIWTAGTRIDIFTEEIGEYALKKG